MLSCQTCGGPVIGSYDLDHQCEDCSAMRWLKNGLTGIHQEPNLIVAIEKQFDAVAEDFEPEPEPKPARFTLATAIEQLREEFNS